MDKKDKKGILFISPSTLTGILLILFPIFIFIIFDSIKVHKEQVAAKLIEKGVSLIRTFEAGTRLGVMTMYWGNDSIQKLLTETSYQPEIEYMLIVDRFGTILAHSDSSMVNKEWDLMPEIKSDAKENEVFHRQKISTDTNQVFEVYKRFTPTKREFESSKRMIISIKRVVSPKHGSSSKDSTQKKGKQNKNQKFEITNVPQSSLIDKDNWFNTYIFAKSVNPQGNKTQEHFIFVGLAMENVKIAQKKYLTEIIGKSVVLLFIGVAGIICLLAFQGYRSAKADLVKVQDFSDTVVDNMPSGLIIIDKDMKITSFNKGAEEILGSEFKVLAPEMELLAREMQEKKMPVNKEVLCSLNGKSDGRNAEKKSILLDVSASPIKEGEIISGYLFLLKDLTQLVQLQKEVETGKRLAAIGKLAAGVAHEIRNPLSSIKGFATYFSERSKKIPQDKEIADIMVQEVERINRSVSQLLEFAKPLPVNFKRIDVKDLLFHALKLVEHDFNRKEIKHKVIVKTNDTVINTDPDRINQVLLNLFLNSVQAMGKNGMLEIIVKKTDQNYIDLEIKDTGKGIEQDMIDKIFDPYFTTRNDGTGLGLAIVHRIIDALHGEIRVQSIVDKGASFTIKIPV